MAPPSLWLLMVLPFALWGTAMTAMAPLLASGGPWFVAAFRLLPAGIVLTVWAVIMDVAGCWILRTLPGFCCSPLWMPACSRGCWPLVLQKTGAGLGSVLIDSQPLLVALLARVLFAESINPVGWLGLASAWQESSASVCPRICWLIGGCCWTHLNSCSCFSLVRGGCCWPHWRWRWEPC